MKITQLEVIPILNQGKANEYLRTYPQNFPKREIIGTSMIPVEPHGWFLTITYNIERS